jgi:chromosomal replication initiation ATPase DnaA
MNPLLTSVVTEVAEEFGSRLSFILSSTRGRPQDARARAIAMHVYRLLAPGKPCYTEVGRVFQRDRTTVQHALSRVTGWVQGEHGFEARLDNVMARAQQRR